MGRLSNVLGVAGAVLLIGGIFVATEVDFGDGDTLASRAPVVGSTLQGLADMADPSGGPMVVVANGGASLTCGAFFALSPKQRNDAMVDLKHGFEAAGAEPGARGAANLAAVSCQLPPQTREVDAAIRTLLSEASDGGDPTVAICAAYQRDVKRMTDVSNAAAEAQVALDDAVDNPDTSETYPMLVRAEREYRKAAGALARLDAESHAGLQLTRMVETGSRKLANAHRAWLRGAPNAAVWTSGAEVSGAEEWFVAMDATTAWLEEESSSPELVALPEVYDCGIGGG